ncbi:hypothetical protein CA11_32290 [Gimesia maris]|uniref:DUF1559 family PulG-like putative transporter n=1 Tax=Gimesia maris TaxID=122 RepID=UPI00118BA3F7|nr:DUF1559 domain-containing protein [Gimesia maris]QDU15405.1 hypothetical protein CA11_32290 [Gimesia maris]
MSAYRFPLACSTVLLLCLCFSCRQNPQEETDRNAVSQQSQAEAESGQTSATGQTSEPAVQTSNVISKQPAETETKTIDPKMVITPGKPMTVERYQAVKAKLKGLGLGLHNSHDEHGAFLPSTEKHPEYYDENGQLKVSWRVHILPYLGQKPLYEQFKLDEAWNSPHNAPLVKRMPDIYRSPDTPADSDKTRFRVFEGQWKKNSRGSASPTTIFPQGKPARIRDIRDGSSNTVMVVEAGPDKAVEWTRPGGLNSEHPKAEFGNAARGIPVLLSDGATLCFKRDIDEGKWKDLIDPNDGKVMDWREFLIIHTTLKPKQIQILQQLRMIAVAFFRYTDKYQRFPPADEQLVDGKPLLSWRVHLLPLLGQDALYQQFKLDEPWDSPHNKTLLEKMPGFYQFGPQGNPGTTRIMTFSGEKSPFPGGPGPRFRDITDGSSNTILFVIAAPDKAVPWTKPEDLPFDSANPIKALGALSTPDFPAVMFDGSLASVPVNIPAATLSKLIQPDDGMITGAELKPYRPQ